MTVGGPERQADPSIAAKENGYNLTGNRACKNNRYIPRQLLMPTLTAFSNMRHTHLGTPESLL